MAANQRMEELKNRHLDDRRPSGTLHIVPSSDESDTNADEELLDPACDPNNPQVIHFEDITSAAFKIRSGIVETPCTWSHLSDQTGMDIYLKKEFLQFTGCFKERGARFALLMLPEEQKRRGVISASLGNHAQGISYHGWKLGIPVTVVMPLAAPIMKIQKCRQYHANVVVRGKNMAEAKQIAMRLGREQGLTYVNGYDHPHIMAGQGTIGLEIVDQVPDVDAVVVPIGGGGLIAGMAVALKTLRPEIKVIGVESDRCPSFSAALDHGSPVQVQFESSLADGLAVPKVGYNAFETARNFIDKLVVVPEDFISIAVLRLIELEKCVVEGAGAAGLAALLSGQLNEFRGKKVVLTLCGGNIDTTILGRCLDRGLACDGRLMKFHVTVSDRPGGLAELCRMLATLGVSIKDLLHERAWVKSDVFSTLVKVVCETRDYEHACELRELLVRSYRNIEFSDFPAAAAAAGDVNEDAATQPPKERSVPPVRWSPTQR